MKISRIFRLCWPDSLLGKLVIFILISGSLLQIFNGYMVWSIQLGYNSHMGRLRANTVAMSYFLLNEMSAEERYAKVNSFTLYQGEPNREILFGVQPNPPSWDSEPSPLAQLVAHGLSQTLSEYAEKPQIMIRSLSDENAKIHRPPYTLEEQLFSFEYTLIEVAIPFHDTGWYTVMLPMVWDSPDAVTKQRMALLAIYGIFSILTIFVAVRILRPVKLLGLAAESFGRDVPENKNIPEIPETGGKEIRETAQSFNRMRRRICGNIAERDRMLAAMAHDLRTPIARMKLRLDDVVPEKLQERLRSNLDEIHSLVEQGMELARSLDTSEKSVQIDLKEFVRRIVSDYSSEDKPVTFRDCQEIPPLYVRPVCLRRCLDNLIGNARKYADGAEVAITVKSKVVIIDVLDSGSGIPKEYLEQVFEPFYRLESSRNRDFGGTGLGLSIARNMAALNNATLELRNRPGGGLCARLTLKR